MNNERIKRIVKNIYPYLIIIVLVVLVRSFIITPAIVDGESMEPTLNNNNIILLNKIDYSLNKLERFDIVVVKYQEPSTNEVKKLVKRVIGLPGEYIEYKDNYLYVDGFIVDENFKHEETLDFKLNSLGYLEIPGNKYLVLGDNRTNSRDSRHIGLIEDKNILGTVSIRIFPFNKIGKVK